MTQTLSDYPFTIYINNKHLESCVLENYIYDKHPGQYSYRNMFDLPKSIDIDQYCNVVYKIPKDGVYFIYFSLTQTMIEEIGLQYMKYTTTSKANTSAKARIKLDNELTNDVKNKKAWILLDNCREGTLACNFDTKRMKEFLGEYEGHTILITSDYGVDTAKIIPTYFRNSWERNVCKTLYNPNTKDMVDKHISWKLDQKNIRQYKCISKNRVLKPHRACISYLIQNDPQLQKDINYSFSSDVAWNMDRQDIIRNKIIPTVDKIYNTVISVYPDTSWEDIYDYIYTTKNKLLDGEHIDLNINQAFNYSDSLYIVHSQAYFQLVTETWYWTNSLFQSEKIFQPIVMLQPFIVCGSPYLIQVMRDLGYDTFDDIIDHSYDKELNHSKRMQLLFYELKRLCKITHDEWATTMQNIKPRLLYNIDHLRNVYNRCNKVKVHYAPRVLP